jgi:hypothetical protein
VPDTSEVVNFAKARRIPNRVPNRVPDTSEVVEPTCYLQQGAVPNRVPAVPNRVPDTSEVVEPTCYLLLTVNLLVLARSVLNRLPYLTVCLSVREFDQ